MKIEITTREIPDTDNKHLEIKVRVDGYDNCKDPWIIRTLVDNDDKVNDSIMKRLGDIFSRWNDKKTPTDISVLNAHHKMANWEIDNPGNGDFFIRSVGLSDEDVTAIRKSRDIQSK